MANYLYNGVELPALPEWDRETHPYCTIFDVKEITNEFVVRVAFSNNPFKYNTNYNAICSGVGDGSSAGTPVTNIIIYRLVDGIWIYYTTYEYRLFTFNTTNVIYTNYDLYSYGTENVYLAASDPVPVLSLTERDLYRKINGKPTKLTLYKKVGGELIPLDEHTKEVKT